MTIQLFANNAKTTLASAVNSSQTTITVAAGKGALFPSPSAGQIFKVTMVSASDATVYEICNCTSRTGDVLTVVRAQEGTTAKPFLLNDVVGNYDTAGTMQSLVQLENLQANTGLFAVASGTANALAISIGSGLTSVPDGMAIWVKAAYANTGATTIQVTLGSTIISAAPIVKGNNSPLVAGDIPSAGYPLTLVYSSTYSAWVITDSNINLTLYAPINSPTLTGTPTAPTPLINDNSTKLATTGYVQNNLANYAPLYQPVFSGGVTSNGSAVNTFVSNITNGPSTGFLATGSTSPVVGYDFFAGYAGPSRVFGVDHLGNVAATNYFTNGGYSVSTNGWSYLTNGLIIQWGTITGTTSVGTGGIYETPLIPITFPRSFPNACFAIFSSVADVTTTGREGSNCTISSNSGAYSLMYCGQNGVGMTGYWYAIGF